MAGQGTNYFANFVNAPQVLQGTPNYNVEISEGQNPPGEFYPAHYLPALISENRIAGSHFVFMPGKVAALDTAGRLIPAYLGYEQRALPASSFVTAYTTLDEDAGIRMANPNVRAYAGYKVATAMNDAGLSGTVPVGIMRYSALTAPGTDPSNPATFFKHGYDTGGARAFSRWAYIQVPIVEVNPRVEALNSTTLDSRILLWPTVASGVPQLSFFTSNTLGTAVTGMKPLATPTNFTPSGMASGNPTEYAVLGRTIFFNRPIPANWVVKYTPIINTPFTCLSYDYGNSSTSVGTNTLAQVGEGTFYGKRVTYDSSSNFVLSVSQATEKVGRVLDIKPGSDKDLALVRTYFRDQGLWQEQPGNSTDGRNTQLSIANAPKLVARIAVNFNTLDY
jgi:hypothetical protein